MLLTVPPRPHAPKQIVHDILKAEWYWGDLGYSDYLDIFINSDVIAMSTIYSMRTELKSVLFLEGWYHECVSTVMQECLWSYPGNDKTDIASFLSWNQNSCIWNMSFNSFNPGHNRSHLIQTWSVHIYIITTVKHVIWLVNTRKGWDNPAREIWKLTSLRILRACYGLKIADKNPFQLPKLAENDDKVKS